MGRRGKMNKIVIACLIGTDQLGDYEQVGLSFTWTTAPCSEETCREHGDIALYILDLASRWR
jgi:hypothetical protein